MMTLNSRTKGAAQVEAVLLPVAQGGIDKALLDSHGIVDQAPKASNWKASKTLTVKPKTSNAFALSYNESEDKTYLTYRFDITNSAAIPVAPVNVHVDVYGPDYAKLATVSTFFETPSVSDDGRTFSFWVRGEVNLPSAGTYHFVVEAQHAGDDSQGKDAGKWALEQNARFVSPPYVTFGAINRGSIEAGTPANLDTKQIAQAAGTAFRRMGYGKAGRTLSPNHWWTPDTSGVVFEANTTTAIGPKNAPSSPIGPLTAQYNAVWAFIGHGSGPGGQTGQKIKFQEFETGEESDSWLYASSTSMSDAPSRMFLDKLPAAYKATTTQATTATMPPLTNSRVMIFLGCWTADSSANTDLPRVALAQGAKCAIGFEGVYYVPGLDELMVDLTSQFKQGKTFAEVESYVQDQLDHWHRASGPFGNMTGRDDNNDPYKISLQSNAKNATLKGVIGAGLVNGLWGWEP